MAADGRRQERTEGLEGELADAAGEVQWLQEVLAEQVVKLVVHRVLHLVPVRSAGR